MSAVPLFVYPSFNYPLTLEKSILLLILLVQLFISFSIPWLNQIIIDEILTQKQFDLIRWIGLTYLAFASINVILHIFLPRILVKLKEEIVKELRLELIESLQREEHHQFSMSNRGNLFTLYEQDIHRMAQFLSYGVKEGIFQMLSLMVTIVVLLSVDLKIGLIALCVVPFYLISPFLYKNKLQRMSELVQEKSSEMNTIIQEVLNGILQIQIFNQQSFFLKRLTHLSQESIELKIKHVTIQKLASATLIVYWFVMLLVLWVGGSQVLAGSLTIGILFVLINYIDRIEWPITCLVELYGEYQGYIIAKKRFKKIVLKENIFLSQGLKELKSIEQLTVEKISYRYKMNHPIVLNQLSLKLKKGDRVGIIGASGSGKSTLMKLLLGLLENQGLSR